MKVEDLVPCYCCSACQSGWEADREHGVTYPQMEIPVEIEHLLPEDARTLTWPSGLKSVSWTVACDALGICRYCKEAVNRDEPTDL